MFQLHSANSPIDPSFFLKSLKDAFIREGCSFDLHAQQDVRVLKIQLEELTGPSIITKAAYNIKSLISTICHTCHQLNRTEDILPILRLLILKDFPILEDFAYSNFQVSHACCTLVFMRSIARGST